MGLRSLNREDSVGMSEKYRQEPLRYLHPSCVIVKKKNEKKMRKSSRHLSHPIFRKGAIC
jgi:hypothetical protein